MPRGRARSTAFGKACGTPGPDALADVPVSLRRRCGVLAAAGLDRDELARDLDREELARDQLDRDPLLHPVDGPQCRLSISSEMRAIA